MFMNIKNVILSILVWAHLINTLNCKELPSMLQIHVSVPSTSPSYTESARAQLIDSNDKTRSKRRFNLREYDFWKDGNKTKIIVSQNDSNLEDTMYQYSLNNDDYLLPVDVSVIKLFVKIFLYLLS